jgi:hypothetical protein
MNGNNYPNPRIWIILPASVLVLVGILFLVVFLFRGCLSARHAGGVLADSRRARVNDSITIASALSRVSLEEFGREVERARGDSLAALLASRATVWRTRVLPGRVDTLIARDTLRDSVLVAGADVRACLLADSSLSVLSDSLRGELVQVRYDLQTCEKRPTSCNGWSAFGLGFGLGATVGAAACLVVR